MGQLNSILAFNRGLVSRLGLARVDIKRVGLSAEIMDNWMPRVLGSMSLRPGLKYLGATLSNAAARFLPFIFSTNDTALIELTEGAMRVWVGDALVSRAAVSTAVVNGNFTSNLANWSDEDEAGATSSWVSPGYLQLVGDGTNAAIRRQLIGVAAGDVGVEQALYIVVARGPVSFRAGSLAGTSDYIAETVLNEGIHALALTPTATFFWIDFLSRQIPAVWVDSCNIEGAGVMTLPTPWGAADLGLVRIDQSGDVIFAACKGFQQRRIERRATRSWSIVKYLPDDGPFKVRNVGPITISPSALSGDITLVASDALFHAGHIGALFKIVSDGQTVNTSVSAQNEFTNPIRVVGVGTDRAFTASNTGVFVATTVLQRSIGSDSGPWVDVPTKSWTAPFVDIYTDGLDNQEVWYRLGVKTGDYTSGTAVEVLTINTGSITGVVRVTSFFSSLQVGAQVLKALGANLVATDNWSEGEWSDYRGWPSSVALHEGRLWWAGKSKIWASVSDAFDSFDEDFLGDAGPLSRSIGSGPVDTINWLMSLQRLLMGAQGAEYTVRSTALDEPITPTNFNLKPGSNQGSAAVRPVKIDQRGLFVNRSGIKVFELEMGNNYPSYDFKAGDLMALVPEIGRPGIVRMDVQRQPDTRVHCVRSDGVAVVGVSDKDEDVQAWVTVSTNGVIEDVVVLPALAGNVDDQVYYVVKRTINGATVRYLEKWAQEVDCRGDKQLCDLADAYVTYSGGATRHITGLGHLEGEEVVVWADGADVGTDDSATTWTQRYTVSGGTITLTDAASNVVVGLGYTAPFKSSKLGQATQDVQSPLNTQKKINHLGLVMADVHSKGVRYGADFTVMDDLPSTVNGVDIGNVVLTDYDENPSEFPGTWTTDSRLCLLAQAPRPVTMLATTVDIEVHK
jgi:hypothetical protein